MNLEAFLVQITRVKRAPWKNGKAPHKPILLLALADWFDRHQPVDALVPFDEDLVQLFKEDWGLLVDAASYSAALITQPFHYLHSDGFWTPVNGKGEWMQVQLKSIKRLYEENAAGRLSDDAFRYFQQPETRELIRMKLLDVYFPYTKHLYIAARGMDGLILDIEADVLRETTEGATRYERRVTGMKVWEGYIRSSKFVDNVRYHYDYTCCISGLRIDDYPMMVEACHIKRHSLCGINTVDNGLALCPNLHRAFDAGLISLTDDYKVIVKHKLVESDTSYSLKKLEGRKIRLPKEERFWPGREWVKWQREGNEYC